MSAAPAAVHAARPRVPWAVTLVTVPMVLVLLALGTWQVERLHWKEALIARVRERMAQPPVPLPAALPDPDAFDLRRVTVTGRFLNDRAMVMLARPRQGQVGYEVVTPLLRDDGGPPVLVNRGWIPMDRRDAATRPDAGPAGRVTVAGIARLPRPPGWLTPDNVPGDPVWRRADPAAMAAAAKLPAVAPVVVEALPAPAPPGDLAGAPAGIEPRVELPNNHLQYAVTWYGLAVALLVIYVLYLRRRRFSDPA